MIEHEEQIQKQFINIVRRNILLPRQTYKTVWNTYCVTTNHERYLQPTETAF